MSSKPLSAPVNDVPKPCCPFCGSSASTVYKSHGDPEAVVYHRRRLCSDCGRRWPTIEALNKPRFSRELAAAGLSFADLGLE